VSVNTFGIVGCSKVFEKRFFISAKKTTKAKILILGSRNKNKSKKKSNELNIKHYGNYEDVFKNKQVDTIYISTPINKRKKLFDLALKYKKNIFCEKPAFSDYKTANKYYKLFYKNNIMIFDCWMFLFHSQHQCFKKIFLKEFKNKPFNFKSDFFYPYPDKNNIRLKKKLKGGVFFDTFGYTLYSSMLFMKKPLEIKSNINYDKKLGIDNKFASQIKYENKCKSLLKVKFSKNYKSTYEVYNSEKILRCLRAYSINTDQIPKIYFKNKITKKSKVFWFNSDDQFKKMINYFSKIIMSNDKKNYLKYINNSLNFYNIYEKSYKSAINDIKLTL